MNGDIKDALVAAMFALGESREDIQQALGGMELPTWTRGDKNARASALAHRLHAIARAAMECEA